MVTIDADGRAQVASQLGEILDALDEPVVLVDAGEPEVLHVNAAGRELWGGDAAEITKADSPFWAGLAKAPWRREDLLARIAAAGAGEPQRFSWASRSGTQFLWMEMEARSAKAAGRPLVVLTARTHEGDRRVRTAFEEAPHGMAITDPSGRYLEVNRTMTRTFGYAESELIGRSFADLLDPTEEPPRDPSNRERRCQRKDGGTLWIEESTTAVRADDGHTLYAVSLYEDVTDRKQRELQRASLEEQLRRAQRMEAVGRLAGGIAHDFNNMLSIILNYADFARRVSADGRARDYLDAIRKGALRAAGLTRQLMIFGRRDDAAPEVTDLNAVVSDLERLLRRTLGEDVEMSTRLTPDLWRVWMALPHAEQVIMNLAVNARDAMPRGGRLFVATENAVLGEEDVRRHLDARPGQYVILSVQDTGVGMSADVLEHAFEPFFTTKEPGQGTGLGLSIVYGIVQEAHGFIDVKSAPGIGTTFRICLPATEQDADVQTSIDGEPPPGRGEKVLVVEDEPGVRALTVQILKENGYAVREADGPDTALEICRSAPEPFDLVLTDVIMPRMSGADLAMLIRARWRSTKVLFMSGYAADRLDQYRDQVADVVLLQKPFNGDELLHAMRRMLDEE